MNTNILFKYLLLLFPFLSFSQYNVIYEMNWKPIKTDTTKHKEYGVLSLNPKYAIFEAMDNFKRDSIQTAVVKNYYKNKGQLHLPDDRTDAKFSSVIIKNQSTKEIKVEEKIFSSVYKYSCTPTLKWKIHNNKQEMFFDYPVKKATLDFGGRKWTALYTEHIPIPEGPYKFGGLPGLILKISDDSGDYSFEIKGITKDITDLSERNFSYNVISLTPKKWRTFWEKYTKQPSMVFANMNTEETTYVIDGKDINDKEVKNNFDMQQRKKIEFFSKNPIELVPICP